MKDRVFQLCDIVRETSFAIHKWASRIEHGLLANFGAPVFFIKKYVKTDVSGS